MIELGKKQELKIVKEVEFGVYLGEEENTEDKVLLPGKQVPKGARIGDAVEVFIYKDSKDRLISTVNEPKVKLGEVALLKVAEVGTIGAFLEWGLEKDLLLPFKEQTRRVCQGEEHVVALYIDKSSRLCATMKVYPYLRTDSSYQKDDKVIGTVYEINDQIGAFVAVDNKYSGLIPAKEYFGTYKPGDSVEARVTEVKEDGKLNLSIREKTHIQIDADAEHVMEMIEQYDGVLPYNDKVSPDIIKKDLGLSKNAFKRAVGRLLKEGRIEITEKNIRKIL